jgi:hypothetical protein
MLPKKVASTTKLGANDSYIHQAHRQPGYAKTSLFQMRKIGYTIFDIYQQRTTASNNAWRSTHGHGAAETSRDSGISNGDGGRAQSCWESHAVLTP